MRPIRKTAAALLVLTSLVAAARANPRLRGAPAGAERGRLSVYFRDEMVGFEDYAWSEDEFGYTLEVTGRMTKPLDLVIERMTLHLNKSFIPLSYIFKGTIGGISQEVTSSLSEGRAENVLVAAGAESRFEAQVRRDAFLLPNPMFSPYLVLAKKFRCGLAEKADCSAYIIPQMEIPLTVEPVADAPCRLALSMAGVRSELETDPDGSLLSLVIPDQSLKVVRNPA
jgi:hypothetical protein